MKVSLESSPGQLRPVPPIVSHSKLITSPSIPHGMVQWSCAGRGLPSMPDSVACDFLRVTSRPVWLRVSSSCRLRVSIPINPRAAPGSTKRPWRGMPLIVCMNACMCMWLLLDVYKVSMHKGMCKECLLAISAGEGRGTRG